MTRPLAILATVLLVVLGAGVAMASLPGRAAARLDLSADRFDARQLLALDGAVRHQRLAVIHEITGDGADFDRLVGLATRDGHGSLQSVALGR